MKMNFLYCFFLALPFLFSCERSGQETPEKPEEGGSIPVAATEPFTVSVSSFNLLGVYSKLAWEPRQEAVKAIITRTDHDPDVIGFQECSTNPIKSSMPTLLANAYTFHVSADSNCDPALIAWKKDKYTLVEGGITDMLQANLEYTAATKKSNLTHWVRLKEKAGGREFLLYNIHVKTNSSSVSYQKLRYDCIQGLLEAAAFRSKHAGDIPVLIVGDFNNYLQTVEEGCISAPAACLAGGYADAASAAATRKNFQYKTYVTDVDEGVVSTWSSKDSRLDYIFVWSSKGAAVESYQTVIDFVPGSTTRINTPVPSDHCPVNAVIKFN